MLRAEDRERLDAVFGVLDCAIAPPNKSVAKIPEYDVLYGTWKLVLATESDGTYEITEQTAVKMLVEARRAALTGNEEHHKMIADALEGVAFETALYTPISDQIKAMEGMYA